MGVADAQGTGTYLSVYGVDQELTALLQTEAIAFTNMDWKDSCPFDR